jgi:acyl-CoA synthetase (AMP-forming)/AMP-acid ligase II
MFLNIADRLRTSAQLCPHQRAVVFPEGRDRAGRVRWTHLTFRELDEEADRIARGLIELGVQPGQRLVTFVPPSIESIAFTFGIFRSGAVCTMIDPGMGRSSVFRCLDQCEPDGFVAIPLVHAVRWLKGRRYREAKHNVVIGRSWFKFGATGDRRLV